MVSVTALGLMRGASYDGVDVALINSDCEAIGGLGPAVYRAYGEDGRTAPDRRRRRAAVRRRLFFNALHRG